MEYVIAKIATRENYYARLTVMDALVDVVEDDGLAYDIYYMYDSYDLDSDTDECKVYDIEHVSIQIHLKRVTD